MRQIIPIISLLLLFIAEDIWASSKIDTIYLQHGDRVTGEVKSLNNNYLKLSTNDISTITIEWNKIDSVKILNNMRIVFEDGQIVYGKMMPSGEDRSCYIWSNIGEPRLTLLSNIVQLSPLEDKFIDGITGSLSTGGSYTKANDILQLNLNASLTYTAEKNQYEISYDGNVTSQDTLDNSERMNAGLTFRRLLPENWFVVSDLGFESNTEQNLDLRTSFSVGGGNSIVNTNRSVLRLGVGLQGSRELSEGDTQNSIEALLAAGYSLFVYDSPKITFSTYSTVAPSLSELGRIRFDIDSNLTWEIFSDFYIKYTFYYSYDSQPLSETAEKNDWAVNLLGVEYKF